jgi:hypothetical protein
MRAYSTVGFLLFVLALMYNIYAHVHIYISAGLIRFRPLSLPALNYYTFEGAEIKPGKHSYTRIKPLPLTNSHGRYITATPERTLFSVGEWPLPLPTAFVTYSALKVGPNTSRKEPPNSVMARDSKLTLR